MSPIKNARSLLSVPSNQNLDSNKYQSSSGLSASNLLAPVPEKKAHVHFRNQSVGLDNSPILVQDSGLSETGSSELSSVLEEEAKVLGAQL